MEAILQKYLDQALSLGASYADIRIEDIQSQNIHVKNEGIEQLVNGEKKGFGIRVLKNGSWGFASSNLYTDSEIEKTLKRAIRIAEVSASVSQQKITLHPVPVVKDTVPSLAKTDPFTISLSEKIDLLKEATAAMKIHPSVMIRNATFSFRKLYKIFASTEGSYIRQERHETGCGITAFARNESDIQSRSYPNAFGGDYSTYGWEFVLATDLVGHAEQCAQEAIELSKAPTCPSGTKDIIIMGNQLALQIHESIGHPAELDRVLGFEAAYAGTSYMTLDKLDVSQIASTIVDITADATIPGSFGYFAYDDEGVKGQRDFIIKSGVLSGYLNSRETCSITGSKPMGAMRADGYWNYPLIRMTSINLEPGNQTLEDLVSGIDDGILFDGIKSWSIDDRRLNFQFGTQYGRRIKNGQLREVVKNPTYAGISPVFWNSCDAIGNADLWHVYGVPNCGKGEPGQTMRLSHGTSPARFRNIKVGVTE